MAPTTMKRFVLAFQNGPDGIQLQSDAPVPKLTTQTEILIRIKSLSLNARDPQSARGVYPSPDPIPKDVVPISDASGEVVEVGNGVTDFKVGDRVSPIVFPGHHTGVTLSPASRGRAIGFAQDGVAAEYFVCDQSDAVLIPKNWSHEEASTLPVAAATSWKSLFGHHPSLHPGQTVLCLGTGGVSLFAAQLALNAGAKVVVSSSSQSKLDRAVQLLTPLAKGDAKELIKTVDYSKIDKWDEEVRRLTGGQGVDFVIEIAGRGTLGRSLRSTRGGGTVAISGYLSDYQQIPKALLEEDLAKAILFSGASVKSTFVGSREEIKAMTAALEASSIKPIIDKTFKFEDLKEAYKYVNEGKHFGKVVVTV